MRLASLQKIHLPTYQDDGEAPCSFVGPQLVQDGQTGAPRQNHVQHHHIRALLTDLMQRVGAAIGFEHLISLIGEQLREYGPQPGIVVHQQYAF